MPWNGFEMVSLNVIVSAEDDGTMLLLLLLVLFVGDLARSSPLLEKELRREVDAPPRCDGDATPFPNKSTIFGRNSVGGVVGRLG